MRLVAQEEGLAADRDRLGYDVSRDGRNFLLVKEDPAESGGLTVVLNWFQELERLAPHH